MSESMMDRLHPDLVGPIKFMQSQPDGGLNLDDIPAARVASAEMMEAMTGQMPVVEGVDSEDRMVPGPLDAPEVGIRIYRPANQSGILPAFLWIHGGGYILGDIEMNDVICKYTTLAGECVTVSVDYRLAPENPFPAAIEDCYAALKWLASHAGELDVDVNRIAIGGGSAGGGLAAGLALLARDRGEIEVIAQFLIYPMIDDRNTEPPSDTLPDTLMWTRKNNLIGWSAYLGCEPGGDNISCYAAAARAEDLSGLPPAYIAVGDLDLFAEEDVEYARRLINAGVPTELHVYPGGCHAFDGLAPEADISRQATEAFYQALKRALHGY